MLSSSQVNGILGVLGGSDKNHAKSEQRSSHFSKCSEIAAYLLEESVFHNAQNSKSREAMKKQLDNSNEKTFLLILSDIIKLDESLTQSAWKKHLLNTFSEDDLQRSTLTLSSINRLREQYLYVHNIHWVLLHEMLRVDLDKDHPFYEEVAQEVNGWMNSDLVSKLYSYLDYLRTKWRPTHMDYALLQSYASPKNGKSTADFIDNNGGSSNGASASTINSPVDTLFSTNDVARIAHINDHAWAVEYLREIGCVIDALILLSYSRHSVSLTELSSAVCSFASHPLSLSSCTALQTLMQGRLQTELEVLDNVIEAVNFKFLVFFTESLQFWRAYQPLENPQPLVKGHVGSSAVLSSTRPHPLLESVTVGNEHDIEPTVAAISQLSVSLSSNLSAAVNSAVVSSSKCTAGSGHSVGMGHYMSAIKMTALLWDLFLQFYVLPFKTLLDRMDLISYNKFCELMDALDAEIVENVAGIIHSGLILSAVNSSNGSYNSYEVRNRKKWSIANSIAVAITDELPNRSSNSSYGSDMNSVDNIGKEVRALEHPNVFIYCSIMQELVGIIIQSKVLRLNSSIAELGPVTALIESTFRRREDLCKGFWSCWNEATESFANESTLNSEGVSVSVSHSHPLCRLVQTLLEKSAHDPVYLWRILGALVCSPSSCVAVLNILNSPVQIVTYENPEMLHYKERLSLAGLQNGLTSPSFDLDQWDTLSDWLREKDGNIAIGTRVTKVDRARKGSINTLVRSTHLAENSAAFSSLHNPNNGAVGVVLDVDVGQGTCLVQWDDRCLWWTIVFDIISKLALQEQLPSMTEMQTYTAAISLVASILTGSQQSLVSAYFLDMKWNEVTLFLLLRELSLPQLYPLFSEHNLCISHLRADPSKAYDTLTQQLGIQGYQAEQIVGRIISPTAIDSALYEFTCAHVLAKAAASTVYLTAEGILCLRSSGGVVGSGTAVDDSRIASKLLCYTALFQASCRLMCQLPVISSHYAQCAISVAASSCPQSINGLEKELLGNGVHGVFLKVAQSIPELRDFVFRCVSNQSASWFHNVRLWKWCDSSPTKRVFSHLDQSSSGKVPVGDLAHGLSELLRQPVSVDFLLDLLFHFGIGGNNSNADSTVNYAEFLLILTGVDVKEEFTIFDCESAKPLLVSPETASVNEDLSVQRLKRLELHSSVKEFRSKVMLAALNLTEQRGTVPGGGGFTRASLIFALNQFHHIFRTTVESCDDGEIYNLCSMLLSSMDCLNTAMDTVSPVADDTASFSGSSGTCEAFLLVELVRSNSQFIQSLAQTAMLLGIVALQNQSLHLPPRSRTFKDLLQTSTLWGIPQEGCKATMTSIYTTSLPLSFSQFSAFSNRISPLLMECLLRISCAACELLDKLLLFATTKNDQVLMSTILAVISAPCSQLTGLSWLPTALCSPTRTLDGNGSSATICAGENISTYSNSFGAFGATASAFPVHRTNLTTLAGMIEVGTLGATTVARAGTSEGSSSSCCIKTDDKNASSSSIVAVLSAQLAYCSTTLLLHIVRAFPRGTQNNIVAELLGKDNLTAFCSSICSALSVDDLNHPTIPLGYSRSATVSHFGFERSKKVAVMMLLLQLSRLEPATFTCLLSTTCDEISHVGSALPIHTAPPLPSFVPQQSALLKAVLGMLGSAELLYVKQPLLLHILFELLVALTKTPENLNPIAIDSILYLMQSKKFWDHVTVPLMVDAPSPAKVLYSMKVNAIDFQAVAFVNSAVDVVTSAHSFAQLFTDSFVECTGVKSYPDDTSVPRTCSSTSLSAATASSVVNNQPIGSMKADQLHYSVLLSCQQLQCHASALQLLSLERYGILYNLNSQAAVSISKKLHAFYVRATKCHRFLSWTKHYLDSPMMSAKQCQSLAQQALGLGIDLASIRSIVTVDHDISSMKSPYALNYLYSTCTVEELLHSSYIEMAHNNLVISTTDKVNLYCLGRFKASLEGYNLASIASNAALHLIRCWREFLEFYVLPGSAVKQYLERKQRCSGEKSNDSYANSDNSSVPRLPISDPGTLEDSPATGAYNSSPVVGSLSPITNESNASPMSQKCSSFTGDKRSYEMVTEITTQLEKHRTDFSMDSAVGRGALAEKCELLVSMIHHQLKTVSSRALDPSKSEVAARELGSMRLTQDKMERLLDKLDDCYRDLIYSYTPLRGAVQHNPCDLGLLLPLSPGSNTCIGDNKRYANGEEFANEAREKIALRLLTAMLLLLNSIYSFNSSEEVRSRLSQRRRSLFQFASTALSNLLSVYGVQVFARATCGRSATGLSGCEDTSYNYKFTHGEPPIEESKASSNSSLVSSLQPEAQQRVNGSIMGVSQSIANVCLQIMKLCIPRSSGTPLISLTDSDCWAQHLRVNHTISLLSATVKGLSESCSTLPYHECQYGGWQTADVLSGPGGKESLSTPRTSAGVPIPSGSSSSKSLTYADMKELTYTMVGVVDTAISAIAANIITVGQDAEQLNSLVMTLQNASVLKEFQKLLLLQDEAVVAVLFGYNCMNFSSSSNARKSSVHICTGFESSSAAESTVAYFWIRSMYLIELIMSKMTAHTENKPANLTEKEFALSRSICNFIRTYIHLLIIPMQPGAYVRFSLQQLVLIRKTASLFVTANTHFPGWKAQLPVVNEEITRRSVSLLRTLSLLLWHGDDMESNEQQRRMLSHCIAVTEIEKREEHTHVQSRSVVGPKNLVSAANSDSESSQHVRFGRNTYHEFGSSIMKSSEQQQQDEDLKGPVLKVANSNSSGSVISPCENLHKNSGTISILKNPVTFDTIEGDKNLGLEKGSTSFGRPQLSSSSLHLPSQCGASEFLLDAEIYMIAAAVPLTSLVRQSTPAPLEISAYDEYGHPVYPVGCRVFFMSELTGTLLEGFVQRHCGGNDSCFDVLLLNDMVESNVHPSQVAYTACPLVRFLAVCDLAKHSITDIASLGLSGGPSSSVPVPNSPEEATAVSLSTAHLMRMLQLVTSPLSEDRLLVRGSKRAVHCAGSTNTTTTRTAQCIACDMKILAEQLAWLIVANIAHLALAPQGREASMLHQLIDLRCLLRYRPANGSTSDNELTCTPKGFERISPLPSITQKPSRQWMKSPDWVAYAMWIDKWCEEIYFLLGRGRLTLSEGISNEQDVIAEAEESTETILWRQRKKRIGLRARIEWVQSPDEV